MDQTSKENARVEKVTGNGLSRHERGKWAAPKVRRLMAQNTNTGSCPVCSSEKKVASGPS